MSANLKHFTLTNPPRKGAKQPQHSAEFLRAFVQETLALIEEGLRRDGVVRLHEFGTFQLKWINERRGRNPQTGAPLVIPGQYRVTFKPASKVETRLNRRYAHLKAEVIEAPALAPSTYKPANTSAPKPGVAQPLAKHFLPIFVRSPFPPSTNRLRFDFVEEEENEYEEIEVGELEEVLAPRPMNFEEQTEPRRNHTKRVRWYGSFLMLLLFMLLAFTTPLHEEKNTLQTASIVAVKNNVANDATKEPEKPPAFPGGSHLVAQGDNLWQLAGRYYVDHYLWPNIYRVNTVVAPNPDVLEPQTTLALPVLNGPHDNLTAVDRRNVAEGYFRVFDYYRSTQKHLAPFALWAAVRYDPKILETHGESITEAELAFLKAHDVEGLAVR